MKTRATPLQLLALGAPLWVAYLAAQHQDNETPRIIPTPIQRKAAYGAGYALAALCRALWWGVVIGTATGVTIFWVNALTPH